MEVNTRWVDSDKETKNNCYAAKKCNDDNLKNPIDVLLKY